MAIRSGKRIKFKFVWTKELIFLISGLVVLILATVIMALPNDQKNIYDDYTLAGASLNSDHVFETIKYKKLAKEIAKQDEDDIMYVYYGSLACTNCVSNIGTIDNAAQAFDIETVYYLDAVFVDEAEDLDDAEFLADIDAMEVKLGGVDLLSYPALWVFKGGELVYTTDEWKLSDSSTTIEGTWKLASYKVFGTNW